MRISHSSSSIGIRGISSSTAAISTSRPTTIPIDGYTANSDIRGPQFFTDFAGATPAIKNYSFFFAADRFLDESGAVHQADVQYFVSAVFKNQFSLDGVGGSSGTASLVWHPGRSRLQRPDTLHVELHRLSVLSRRRDAAVQSLPDPDRLSRWHADTDRRELLSGVRSAMITCICSRS